MAEVTSIKLIYGTAWKKDRTAELVYKALRCGFRAIDSATNPQHYNESGAGDGVRMAVAEGVVERQDLFIQTKFMAPEDQRVRTSWDDSDPLEDMVHQSVRSSLQNFTIVGEEPYLDSVLLHSPMRTMYHTVVVWKELEKYVPNRVRRLGICNADVETVNTLHGHMDVDPFFVQNPFQYDRDFDIEMRRFCCDRGMLFQSFWTLTANEHIAQKPIVAHVAQMAGVQLIPAYFSLVMSLGNIAILDGTTREVSMKSDLEGVDKVRDWALGQGATEWQAAVEVFRAMLEEDDLRS
ncbi:hypothetical protein XA68_13708 [Ophiocordyceps unilateralis]|uniref:NADP-dependent oxidoreductase domain-containing protein n=1 Tax=Ophiocordyceps unilateralis TaxID=268505 RepID=A0A2A9PBM7_OPHUN|nr:hypothetical protein XA68_13708 [Ophiocordyceps unilateralis]